MNDNQFKQHVINVVEKVGFIEVSESDRREHMKALDDLRQSGKIEVVRPGAEYTRYEVKFPVVPNPDYRPQSIHDLKHRW